MFRISQIVRLRKSNKSHTISHRLSWRFLFSYFLALKDENCDMAILQALRDRFSSVGLVFDRKSPLNFRNSFMLLTLCLGSSLNCIHLFYETNTFEEFAYSMCPSSTIVLGTILFVITIWKTRSFHDLFDKLEKSIAKRELH